MVLTKGDGTTVTTYKPRPCGACKRCKYGADRSADCGGAYWCRTVAKDGHGSLFVQDPNGGTERTF